MYRKSERSLNDYLEDIIGEIKNIESFVHMMEIHSSTSNEVPMEAMAMSRARLIPHHRG